MITKQELIDFELDIAEEFNAGKIRTPIHLSGGNEDQLLEISEQFKSGDWYFNSWRSHYSALLSGIPPEKVKAQIIDGKSMTLCWPEHNFFSSAIFAGSCPIALGVAWQIKQNGGKEMVWLFIGDMCARSGLAYECANYAAAHGLPLVIVIENNKKSVCTNTEEVWRGIPTIPSLYKYEYELPWPHAGSGKRIQF